MLDRTQKATLRRVLLFCQMFEYGFGRAGVWTIGDPVAAGYNTFADIHLVFTMFLVDKKHAPMGGFIYPILANLGRASLLDGVRKVLNRRVREITFEAYLRSYRNKLATHGDLSATALAGAARRIVLRPKPSRRIQTLLGDLREAVHDLTMAIHAEIQPPRTRKIRRVG